MAATRERARGLILAGKVRLGDEVADKPGRMVFEDSDISVHGDIHPFVGRGGQKLEHALNVFRISPAGKIALDVGASTGGFTDCLLQKGAEKVFALDVGYGQLDWKLRNDPRVVCLDRKNVRYLTPEDLGTSVDLAVIDVSFISLRLAVPPVLKILKSNGDLVSLVKPQFEVGKAEVENRGIIKNPEKHLKVLLTLCDFIHQQGWVLHRLTASPILGQKGNREFLIHCVRQGLAETVDETAIREECGL